MSRFDQQRQNVDTQYNANGDIITAVEPDPYPEVHTFQDGGCVAKIFMGIGGLLALLSFLGALGAMGYMFFTFSSGFGSTSFEGTRSTIGEFGKGFPLFFVGFCGFAIGLIFLMIGNGIARTTASRKRDQRMAQNRVRRNQ